MGGKVANFDIRAQTVVQLGTAVISVVALVLSVVAFYSQSSVNDVQLQNDQSRYASRVAWYVDSNEQVTVQNLSIVPISAGVLMAYDLNGQAVNDLALGTIPPCVLVKLDAEQSNASLPAWPGIYDAVPATFQTMLFEDAKGYWSIGSGKAPVAISDSEYREKARFTTPNGSGGRFTSDGSGPPEPITGFATSPASDCGAG